MTEETIGWVGIVLLVAAGLAIGVEMSVAAVWAVALTKRTRILSERLAVERGMVESDLEKLRLAIEETQRLWKPYRTILRWVRHPLAFALMQSYLRGRVAR